MSNRDYFAFQGLPSCCQAAITAHLVKSDHLCELAAIIKVNHIFVNVVGMFAIL